MPPSDEPPVLVGPTLDAAARRLALTGSSSPRLDALLLLEDVTGLARPSLFAHPERVLTDEQAAQFQALLARRSSSEPMAYILGRREFYGRRFHTDARALIPRPETEMLVDLGKELLDQTSGRAGSFGSRVVVWGSEAPPEGNMFSPAPAAQEEGSSGAFLCRLPLGGAGGGGGGFRKILSGRGTIVDVGTGSGAIAVTLAAETGLKVVGLDVSRPALRLARQNACALGQDQHVLLVQGSLLEPLRGPLRLVLANLPYVPDARPLSPEVARYEPPRALFGGPAGTTLIRALLVQSVRLLGPGSLLACEIDDGQARELKGEAAHLFPAARVEVLRDAAGLQRVLWVRLPD